MTASLAQQRLDKFIELLDHPAFPSCGHIAEGALVAFCALHGGSLLCVDCLGEHNAVRHTDESLTCDHCGAPSVVAHWHQVPTVLVRIRPPADDVMLLAGALIEVALSSGCSVHVEETRADVGALGGDPFSPN